jgi:hypothetical protein
MVMKIIIVLVSMIFMGCAASPPKIDLGSYSNNNDKFPVANSGENYEYYKISTNMDWPIGVTPDQLKNYVTWEHAIDLIVDEQVITTAQAHSLAVQLELLNGTWVSTIEPSIDTIFAVLRKCGEPCENVGQITE